MKLIKLILTTLLAALVAGCATRQAIDLPPAGQPIEGVYLGERIIVTLRDGSKEDVTLWEIYDDGIGTNGGYFYYQDITKVQIVNEVDKGKVAAGIAGALLIVLYIGAAAAAGAVGAYSGF